MDLNIPERSRIFPHASGAVEQYRVKILNQRQGDGRAFSYGADAFSYRLPAIEDFRYVVPPVERERTTPVWATTTSSNVVAVLSMRFEA